MKKRAAKTALIVVEIIAILIAVAAAGAVFLFWRLDSGPVPLNVFKPSIVFAIERRLPEGYAVEIAGVDLTRAAGEVRRRREVIVSVSGLRVLDSDNKEAASAAEIFCVFDFGDLISGKVGPKTIIASGAKFRIVRNENQFVELPAVQPRKKKSVSNILSPIFDGRILKSAFERAEMPNAEIAFFDAASGRSWLAPAANVSLHRHDGRLEASLDGALNMGVASASISARADYAENSGVISVVAEGSNFPVGDILTMFYGEKAGVLDAPVTGKAVISLSPSGDVLQSSFSARAGEGTLNLGGVNAPVSFIEWETGFDPSRNEFSLDRFAFDINGSGGELSGAVAISFGDDLRKPERIVFDLEAQSLIIDAKEALPEPLTVNSLSLAGGYEVARRRLSIASLQSEFLDIAAKGSLSVVVPGRDDGAARPSPAVTADIAIDGALDPQRLMKAWPKGVAMGARDWIEDRVEAATIDNINFVMDLAQGAVGEGGGLPDEAMALSFDVHDAKAYYDKAMTPLTGASGSGIVRGNSFLLKADRARVGDAAISEGEVEFPVFIPKWQPTYIRFTAAGDADVLLGIIDQQPLSLLSKIELSPDQFSGAARAQIEIMRPNKRDVAQEEYRYAGTATFKNMSVSDLVGDVELSDAKGTVDLKARSLTVKADASLSDAPINIVWKQNFFDEDGPSNIAVAGVIDSSTGDLFGIPSRQILRGPIAFSANAVGELGAIETLDIVADFSGAALRVDALGWRKPADIPAAGDIQIVFEQDIVSIDKINILGGGVEINGKLTFAEGGVLQSVDLPRFYLADAADLSLTAARDASGALAVTATGEFLNGAPMVEQVINGPPAGANDASFDWGLGVSLSARIERIMVRGGVEYRGAALDLRRDATQLQALDFSAFDQFSAPLTVSMTLTGADEGPQRAINARSGAIGSLLAGVFGVSSISGGDGSMLINLHPPGETGFSGIIEARDMHVMDAPLLARIFSAGSLDGLANLLNGEGINLTYAYGEFDFADGVLSVNDMRATGPSVGITADGALSVGQGGEVSLTGAIAPIYQLNSALRNAPIIGDILVGKKGEGLVALAYTVSGETASPSVFVNPLSALTPGIFRRLMQPSRTVDDVANDNKESDSQDNPQLQEN